MIKLRLSIALWLLCGFLVKCESNSEQNGYGNGGTGTTGKAKKIQIVYIKVPLSKVLHNPGNGYNDDERGYSEGGGQGYEGSNGIPGEGRVTNYGSNIGGGNGYGGGGHDSNDYYSASNQNSFDAVRPNNGQEGYGNPGMMYANEEGNRGYGNGGQNNMNYQNDGNLGMAYGAAVGNALPQNANYDSDSGAYGQESQNSGYAQNNNQINYQQTDGYGSNPGFNRPPNDGYEQIGQQNGNEGYGADNYDKGKLRKGTGQIFPKMMANFRPQPLPILTSIPSYAMKGFSSPSFGTNFPSFGPTFGGMTGMQSMPAIPGVSGISGISGIGNKFGMGGAGGLLGGMMGWD